MLADPDVSCRGLRETSEGCEFLINEWSSLKPTLIDPVHWDGPDEGLALALMGVLRVCRKQNPSPLALATKAIRVHRELAERLELNASGRAMYGVKYGSKQEHEYDRERLDNLAMGALAGKVELEAVIAREVAGLRARKAELEAVEAVEASEAGLRARFDSTDRGKLLHRYEVNIERGLHRDIREAMAVGRWTMQMADLIGLAERESRRKGTPGLRNEATAGGVGAAAVSPKVVQGEGFATVDMAITPGWDGKRRQ